MAFHSLYSDRTKGHHATHHKKYEQDGVWTTVSQLIADQRDNHGIELLTPMEYVVDYVCKGLQDSQAQGKASRRKPHE